MFSTDVRISEFNTTHASKPCDRYGSGVVAARRGTEEAKRCGVFSARPHRPWGLPLSAVRWAKAHAVEDLLGLCPFDEDDLYAALDWLAEEQPQIEQRLYQAYVARRGQTRGKPPS